MEYVSFPLAPDFMCNVDRRSYSAGRKYYIWTIGRNGHRDWDLMCRYDQDCL